MNAEQDWGSLRQAWVGAAPGSRPAGEARKSDAAGFDRLALDIRRRSRRLLVFSILEAALAVSFLVASAALVYARPEARIILWAAAVWLFTAVALGYSVRNRRGLWYPETETTESFIAISIRRCEAGLRSIRAGFLLLAAEIVFILLYTLYDLISGWRLTPVRTAVHFGLLAATIAVMSSGLALFGRRKRAELRKWREVERSASAEGNTPAG